MISYQIIFNYGTLIYFMMMVMQVGYLDKKLTRHFFIVKEISTHLKTWQCVRALYSFEPGNVMRGASREGYSK